MADAKWYIVHAYSNFEKKVAQTIREQAEVQGLAELFEDIEVPTEEVVEVVRGRKRTVERRHMPGYVLFHHFWVWLLTFVLMIASTGVALRAIYRFARSRRQSDAR